jgi:hypothetical protein
VARIEEYEPNYRQLVARGVDIIVASGPEISLKSAFALTLLIVIAPFGG